MVEVDILVTESEMRSLTNYAAKSFGGLAVAGLKVKAEKVIPLSKGAFVRGYRCKLSLPNNIDGADLLVKVAGGHISCSGESLKEQLLGRSKFMLKAGAEIYPLDLAELSREQRLLLDRLHTEISERRVTEAGDVLISKTEFVQKCNTLLHRHFLIDGAVDSINATSDAVFNYCIGVNPKSHKAQHWISYLNCAESIDSIETIIPKLMETSLVNPSLNSDVVEILNLEYINRTQASRLASIIDSHLLSSSVRIREDFANQIMDLQPSNECKVFSGVVFGVSQNIFAGKPRFALRVKSDNGQLLEIESGSEYFGGIISKEDLLSVVKNQTPVKIEGMVTSVNNGIKIGDRVLFPAITTVTAKRLDFERDAPKVEHHYAIAKQKLG